MKAEPVHQPAHDPPPAPAESQRRRKRGLVVAVVLAAIIAAGAAVVLLLPNDESPSRTAASLRASSAAVAPAIRAAVSASRLADVRIAGELASESAAALATQAGVVSAVDDDAHRAAAARATSVHRALAAHLANLAALSARDVDEWPSLKQDLQQDSLDLRASQPAIEKLQLSAKAPLTVAPNDVDAAVASVDAVINRADRLLRRWRASSRAARARNRRATGAINSYAETMRGHLSRYDQLRNDTSAFIEKVDTESATFDEAYAILGDGVQSRQSLKETLTALKPPEGLSSAQNRIVAVLADATQAMDDALMAISEYQFNQFDYDFDYKSTPSWKQFEQASARVSASYGTARSNWERQVKARLKSVQRRDLPPRPAV